VSCGWIRRIKKQRYALGERERVDIVRDFYENYYSRVFSNKGLSSIFNSLTHKKLESNYIHNKINTDKKFTVMEIGAGQGEHIKYVKHSYSSYLMVDIIPHPDLSNIPAKADWQTVDFCEKKINLGTFDRIISTCVFHHLDDPVTAIENVKKHLKPGGTFSLFLPSDPGILNRLLRKICVTPSVGKLGFKHYEVVNAREHKNHYWSLKTNLDFQFKGYEITKKYYPINIPLGNFSLFSIWQIKSKCSGCQ